MILALYVVSLLAMVAGIVLSIMARKHRTPSAPSMPSFNPAHWFQPWKIPDWFTHRGLQLYLTGWVLLSLGAVLALILFTQYPIQPGG